MLRQFRVANHRSVRDESRLQVLGAPVAAVVGATASGKSNLVDGLRWMQHAVASSLTMWQPGTGIPRAPFKLDPAYTAKPSLFAVELRLDGVRYQYGFQATDETVTMEWLYAYPKDRLLSVFVRDGAQFRFGHTDSRVARLLRDMTRDDGLFLSVAGRSGWRHADAVFGWFDRGLAVRQGPVEASERDIAARIRQHPPERWAELVELIKAAGLGIADVGRSRGLQFQQGPGEVPLSFAEQSAGTRGWVAVLVDVLDALQEGTPYVADDLDSVLHPRLLAGLIELFRDERTNPKGAQLIFTMHHSAMLGTGRPVLDPDRIWRVDKDATGGSRLAPLRTGGAAGAGWMAPLDGPGGDDGPAPAAVDSLVQARSRVVSPSVVSPSGVVPQQRESGASDG